MAAVPDRSDLPVWLTHQLMSELEQALHAQGLDPKTVPYAWQAMQALHTRVQQQVGALIQDFETALQGMEIQRQQAGLKKVFR